MIKACIFDLDGVLVDTAKYHFLAWSELATKLGIPFKKADNERLKGVSRMKSLDIILELGGKSLTAQEKEKLANTKNRRYTELIASMKTDEVLPGVLDFLSMLKARKIKTALGSASKNARPIIQKTGLLSYFDAIVDGTDIREAKPSPEVFLTGAARLQVAPKYCVVFEDAEAGIAAAKNAAMKSVGVGDSSQLSAADLVISGFGDYAPDTLFNLIENI